MHLGNELQLVTKPSWFYFISWKDSDILKIINRKIIFRECITFKEPGRQNKSDNLSRNAAGFDFGSD